MLRRTTLGTTALLAALGLAGCALPADSGSQSEQPSSQAQSTPGQQQDAAPRIDQPKNLQAAGNACELLKPEQLQQLGLAAEPKPVETLSGDSSCDWSNDNGAVTVTPKSTIGAQQMIKTAKSFGEYHPAEVQGYPANHKGRQSRLCSVDVGVSDSASFRVDFTRTGGKAPEMQDPCGFADTIATQVLKNIPNT